MARSHKNSVASASFVILLASLLFVGRENSDIASIQRLRSQRVTEAEGYIGAARIGQTLHRNDDRAARDGCSSPADDGAPSSNPNRGRFEGRRNPSALSPGELPGYTGWARPEQTLAGYFEVTPLSHPLPPGVSHAKFHSVVESGERFSALLTCSHSRVDGADVVAGAESAPPYECPPGGGALFYVRAYGPSVVTGNVADHGNSSYSVEVPFVDPGEYTLEVVVTFSAPLGFDELPLDRDGDGGGDAEPGYEGYMVSGFPLSIRVDDPWDSSSSRDRRKPWCTLSQLTESSPDSALYKGHWQVIDNVARSSHQPLTPDETAVSLDGYRMGLNSVGVRMRYEYEHCELVHIRDLLGGISGGLDRCLREQLGFDIQLDGAVDRPAESRVDRTGAGEIAVTQAESEKSGAVRPPDDAFEGVHVIFIGDSVMKLEMGFFSKLVRGAAGVKVTFLETNGGIHATLPNVTSALEGIRHREEGGRVERAVLFNTGLHDVDVLCSSKRRRTRTATTVVGMGESCADAYREAMVRMVRALEEYPAALKVFRSTTAGWQKYGNYGFSWRADDAQPQSRSPHLAHHFNGVAFDVLQKHGGSILVADGYWITLPRPDHTQISKGNQVGKHLVHPGFEVLSVFARRWYMMILWALCGDGFEGCMACIGGSGGGASGEGVSDADATA